jgi:hypothetical protein
VSDTVAPTVDTAKGVVESTEDTATGVLGPIKP